MTTEFFLWIRFHVVVTSVVVALLGSAVLVVGLQVDSLNPDPDTHESRGHNKHRNASLLKENSSYEQHRDQGSIFIPRCSGQLGCVQRQVLRNTDQRQNASRFQEEGAVEERGKTRFRLLKRSLLNSNRKSRSRKNANDDRLLQRSHDRQHMGAINAVRFKSPAAFIYVRLKLASTYTISLQLKTTQTEGLIVYAGFQSRHFLAVELVDGEIHYLYDVGRGLRALRASRSGPVNDNRWHTVTILKPSLTQHILHVDNVTEVDVQHDVRSTYLDVSDTLYFGGVPGNLYSSLPKQVKSRVGFLGCLASVVIGKESEVESDEILAEISEEYREQVDDGCHEEGCNQESCSNGGVCLQQQLRSYSCDCAMTSFVGKSCDDESVAYEFGADGGLITFTFIENEKTVTRQDSIAFGFVTTQSDAVLLRITGGTLSDYIEVELIDGNIFVVYNVGTADHPIGELFKKVNDNNYHVLRFSRMGANSTLQVDDFPLLTKIPTGRQLSAFNNMEKIYIGGKSNAMGRLVKPFHGIISGLVVNGLRPLDMAFEGDMRILIEGDTAHVRKPLLRPYSTSSNVVLLKVPSYNRTTTFNPKVFLTNADTGKGSGSDDLIKLPDPGPCPDDVAGSKDLCHGNGDRQPKSLSPASSQIFQRGQTTRYPQLSEPNAEYQTNLSGSSANSPCSLNKYGCQQLEAGSTRRDNFKSDSVNSSSFPSRKSDVTGRTHPMFLSHLNPTRGATNVSELNPSTASTELRTENKVSSSKTDSTKNSSWQVGLAVGLSVGMVLLFLIFAYATYKYRSRDEGTYRIDEGNGYGYDAYNSKPLIHLNGRAKYSRQKAKDNKEWYV